MADLLKERNSTLDSPYLYISQSTGRFVMLLPINAPLESSEPATGTPFLSPSGLAYQFVVGRLYAGDASWLVTKDTLQETASP